MGGLHGTLATDIVERWRDLGPVPWLVAAGAAGVWFALLGLLAAANPRKVDPGAETLELGGPAPPTTALPVAAAFALAVSTLPDDPDDPDDDPIGASIGLGIVAWGGLVAAVEAMAAERDTRRGREVAARWLGFRDMLARLRQQHRRRPQQPRRPRRRATRPPTAGSVGCAG